jgi:GT2 family glycosyltransferase
MEKIAIILTTFLRDKSLYISVNSILNNWINDKYILIIGDQGKYSDKKKQWFWDRGFNRADIGEKRDKFYWNMQFDCGLSYARNFLINTAYSLGAKYCWITADSIKFTDKYNLSPIIEFMEEDPRNGIVGFEIKNRVIWECNIELVKNKHFLLTRDNIEIINRNNINFIKCDVVRNFFLAKTECLIHNQWDNDLKLCEHEDFFWRFKNNAKSFTEEFGADIYQPYKVFWTDYIKAEYLSHRPPEYNLYRKRLYSEFKKKLQKKYGLTGWITYSKSLKETFNKWRKHEKN